MKIGEGFVEVKRIEMLGNVSYGVDYVCWKVFFG